MHAARPLSSSARSVLADEKTGSLEAHRVDASAIAQLAPMWRTWIPDAGPGSLFASPEYASFLLADAPDNHEAGLVLLTRDGEPAGVVPYRRQRHLLGVPTGRIAGLVPPIARPGDDAAIRWATQALCALSRTPCQVEVVHHPSATPAWAPPGWRRTRTHRRALASTTHLGPEWERFVASQRPRFRRHLRYALKALGSEWNLEEVTQDAASWMERANDMLEASINQTQGYGANRLIRLFERQQALLPTFGEKGLRVFALRRGEEVASVLYGVHWHDGFYLFRQGNDLALARVLNESSSFTARAAAYRQLSGEGVQEIHVVGGTGGWPTRDAYVEHHVFERRGLLPALQRAYLRSLSVAGTWRPIRVARSQAARIVPALSRQAA